LAGTAGGYNEFIVFKLVWTDVNEFRTWMCLICGWIYDEAVGLPGLTRVIELILSMAMTGDGPLEERVRV
jgi:hypothetical protein